MKKTWKFLLMAALAVAFVACKPDNSKDDNKNKSEQEQEGEGEGEGEGEDPQPTEHTYSHTLTFGDFGFDDTWLTFGEETSKLSNVTWTLKASITQAYGKFNDQWAWAGGTVLWMNGGDDGDLQSVTLSTSEIPGTIKKIVLDVTVGGGQKYEISAKVGGAAFGSLVEAANLDEEHAVQSAEFTGEASGKIELLVKRTVATEPNIMLRGISVVYLN